MNPPYSGQGNAFQIFMRAFGTPIPPAGLPGQPAILWKIGFKGIQTKITFIGGTIPEIDK